MIAFVVHQTRGNIKKMIRGNFISILFRNIIHHIYFHILKNILFDCLLNLVFIVFSFNYSFSLKYSPQVFPLVFIDSSINEVVILTQIFYSLQRGKCPPLWITPPSLKVTLPNTPILTPSKHYYHVKLKLCYLQKKLQKTAQNTFFSCLYSNLIINVIFPIFLVYPLHLTKLSHRSKTKRVSFMLQV